MRTFIRIPALAVLATAATASANGFILNDHGARSTGRANAVTATIDDGSAVVYNPAGIAVRDGVNVYLGTSLIFPNSSFSEARTGTTTDTQAPVAVTPTLFAHAKLTDLLAIGIGFHAPFGTSLKWPATSPGADVLRESTLRTYFITPVVALDLGRWVPGLSVGGGVDLVPATVRLRRDIFFGDQVGTADLGGNGFGVGGRAGVMYRPAALPELSFGIAYRSKVRMNFSGTGNFDAPEPFRPQLPPDGDISTSITTPQSVLGGVAYRPIEDLELEFDVQWMGWKRFDAINLTLADDSVTVLPRGYQNTTTLRGGAEYRFRSLGLSVRGGYAYDPTPIPRDRLTVALPDINRHVVTAGLGYAIPSPAGMNIFTDLGVLWVMPGSRTTSDVPLEPQLKGQFDVSAWVVGLSFGAQFDAPLFGSGRLVKKQSSRSVRMAAR